MVKKALPRSESRIALTKQPYTIEVEVTPEKAQEFLEKMPANRPVRDKHVDMLARDMKAGHWYLSSNPLAFNTDGAFIDGQHRMLAVIKSGCTVSFFVCYNLEIEAADTIDGGIPRSNGDKLHLNHGILNGKSVAAIARILWVLETDAPAQTRPSIAELTEVVDRWLPEIEWGLSAIGHRIEPGIPSGGAPTIAAFVYMRALAPARIDRLAEKFKNGEGEGVVRAMRSALARDSVKARGSHHFEAILELMLRGIEAYLGGERIARLIPSGVLERARQARQAYEESLRSLPPPLKRAANDT